ncbi:hypothetical protein, partial [Pararhizobium sp. PWRC1-1]|uniref:hypothetical protein n=1 Tax=Pararhizobium sp. PWRC1-1 TaxID=2804566 RepID=UPI003CF4CBCE
MEMHRRKKGAARSGLCRIPQDHPHFPSFSPLWRESSHGASAPVNGLSHATAKRVLRAADAAHWQLCFYVCEKIVLSLVIAFAMASILRARAMMMTLKGLPR